MANRSSKRGLFVALVVLQTVIFGSGNAVTKMAYDSITPLWCLAIRFGLAALVFSALFGSRIARQLAGARLRDWAPAALCMAVAYIACNVALDLTTATNVGFLVALPVVFAPLLSSLANRRRYPLAFLPFQVAVVGGLYLLCSNGGAFALGWGEVLALLSSVALAGALVFGERGLERVDAVAVAGTQIAASFVMSLVCALAMEPPIDLAAVQPFAWGTIAFLVVFSTCLTFLLQNAALGALKSSTVSLLLTGEPVFTAAFSFVLLGETLSAGGLAGAALIVGSVVAATMLDGRSEGAPVVAPADAGAGRAPASAPIAAGLASTPVAAFAPAPAVLVPRSAFAAALDEPTRVDSAFELAAPPVEANPPREDRPGARERAA